MDSLKNLGIAVSPFHGTGAYERLAPVIMIAATLGLGFVADVAPVDGLLHQAAVALFYTSMAVTGGIIRGQFPDPENATSEPATAAPAVPPGG